jgi:predicted TIM-barrel fold metal-dependent hydrolase
MPFDVHVHPWTKDFMKKNGPIMKACAFFKIDSSTLPDSIGELLEGMDEAGVTRGVILGQDTHATPNPAFRNYTIKNDLLAKIAADSKDRLVPFAGIDPNSGRESVKELKRAAKELGIGGLKIHSSANSIYPNDPRMFPIYEFCQERGLPILFHTGTTGLGDCEVKFSKPEFLDEVCQRFPDLRVVMAHFGWPWSDVALAIALRNPNVYVDISGWKPRYLPPNLLPYLGGILSDRFLFGTDYPMIKHQEWLDDFNQNLRPRLKQEVVEKLLHGNAERLLRFTV